MAERRRRRGLYDVLTRRGGVPCNLRQWAFQAAHARAAPRRRDPARAPSSARQRAALGARHAPASRAPRERAPGFLDTMVGRASLSTVSAAAKSPLGSAPWDGHPACSAAPAPSRITVYARYPRGHERRSAGVSTHPRRLGAGTFARLPAAPQRRARSTPPRAPRELREGPLARGARRAAPLGPDPRCSWLAVAPRALSGRARSRSCSRDEPGASQLAEVRASSPARVRPARSGPQTWD